MTAAGGGYQHYVNWAYYTDGIEMNPSRIESIVVEETAKIVSGMYILNPGKTMANVPALAGELTTWHDHQNLCFSGTQLVGHRRGRHVRRGRRSRPTPPMLHVWLVAQPVRALRGHRVARRPPAPPTSTRPRRPRSSPTVEDRRGPVAQLVRAGDS